MSGSLSNPSQLLMRHADALSGSFLINPPADGIMRQLQADGGLRLTAHGSDQPSVEQLRSGERSENVVLFLPKSRARIAMLIDLALSRTAIGGRTWLVGAKKEGIASAARQFGLALTDGGTVRKTDAARHCMLFQAGPGDTARSFDLDAYWESFPVSLPGVDGGPHTLFSLPGVFARGRLDPGTELLLGHLQTSPGQKVLDFGCGAGPITLAAARGGARVTALDSDLLAVLSTRRTLAEAGLTGDVMVSDGFSQVNGSFDLIISNPPFHQGVQTTSQAAHGLIRQAPAYLKPGGSLLLVANAFLDYPRVMQETFGRCRCVAEAGGYKVLKA